MNDNTLMTCLKVDPSTGLPHDYINSWCHIYSALVGLGGDAEVKAFAFRPVMEYEQYYRLHYPAYAERILASSNKVNVRRVDRLARRFNRQRVDFARRDDCCRALKYFYWADRLVRGRFSKMEVKG